MPVPNDRRYLQTHEWFKVDGQTVTIGITKFAADELTDIVHVELPAVGTQIKAGASFSEIESVKAASELYSAISGKVTEVNERLTDEPALVNSDSFNAAWMIKVACPDPSPLNKLMDGPAYDRMTQG
jgi:glycine cleavage system H protein